MISAFGVDHGEISKGVHRAPGAAKILFRRKPRGPKGPNGKKLNDQQVRTSQGTPGPQPAEKIMNRAHAIGEADISAKGIGRAAGRGAAGFGRFVEDHPGFTGAAILGGGTAGGVAYARGNRRKRE